MRIIGYLKQSKVAVALIVVLLIVQAFADLSLPRYTSDLVDVGIQQGGIDETVPDTISKKDLNHLLLLVPSDKQELVKNAYTKSTKSSDTFNYACMLAPDDDERLLRSSYEQDSDGNFALTQQGLEQRKELDSAIALPLVVVHFSDQMAESLKGQQKEGSPAFDGAPGVSGDFDLPQLYAAYRAGAISKTQVEEAMAQAQKAFPYPATGNNGNQSRIRAAWHRHGSHADELPGAAGGSDARGCGIDDDCLDCGWFHRVANGGKNRSRLA